MLEILTYAFIILGVVIFSLIIKPTKKIKNKNESERKNKSSKDSH